MNIQHTTFHLSIHPSIHIRVALAIVNDAAIYIGTSPSLISIVLGVYLEVELLAYMVILFFFFEKSL